jgi:hypothetical protein
MKTIVSVTNYPSMPHRFKISVQSLNVNLSQDVVGGGTGNAAGVALSLARAHQSEEGFFICGHDDVMRHIPPELRNRDGKK